MGVLRKLGDGLLLLLYPGLQFFYFDLVDFYDIVDNEQQLLVNANPLVPAFRTEYTEHFSKLHKLFRKRVYSLTLRLLGCTDLLLLKQHLSLHFSLQVRNAANKFGHVVHVCGKRQRVGVFAIHIR